MTPSPNYYPEPFCQNCDEMAGSFYYDERTETSLCSDCKIKEATQTEQNRIIKIIEDEINQLGRENPEGFNWVSRSEALFMVKRKIEADHE